ncbi:28S ribosomal protein S5, mitochondrial [Copidosoma floridanum]|uniref:28S ribosomal protein S5, mitochondrial n=1 Tax=Copidosoma floridanum TaxID=29053 RepID=UPI0006C9A6E8|nr:28S ribosomal protein S5, mitochondrial [Copidosoma floridanum]
MAFNLLRVYDSFMKPLKHTLQVTKILVNNAGSKNLPVLKPVLPLACQVRLTSFFTRRAAETLWKSVTSVSNAGRNRGRGRGLARKIKDLNRGQYIGMGKINMQWPGLTAPIMRGSTVLKQQRLPDDPEREAKIIKMRDIARTKGSRRVHPLERGWTSAKMGGKKIGPPDPVNDEPFEGFDTYVLEHKIVNHMTGNLGRKRSFSSFVVTGNFDGLVGFGLGKSSEGKTALRIAKNRAGQKLMFVPRYNNHTVYHDFFSQFGSTKLFVSKKPEGFGLRCHRALVCACQIMGIKDLRVKIEGAINYQHIIKAFLIGLLKQKTHAELAEEKKLHLVEMRPENWNYPKVVASPSVVRKPEEIRSTEVMDFTQYVLGGKVVLQKIKPSPFYIEFPSHKIRLRKYERQRNQNQVRIRMLAEHGEIRSFLTDKYPEARPQLWTKKMKEQSEQAD